uniref:Uncharacterized protein n=1 Tax=viral metagenome TaxID=1070528 RepID=A0A6C0LQW3_9ZZZZ
MFIDLKSNQFNSKIDKIINKLIHIRCCSDVNKSILERHVCAIFIEKGQQCFKSYVNWNESRRLQK